MEQGKVEVFHCKGFLTKYEDGQWKLLSGNEPTIIQVFKPNVLFFRNTNIPSLNFSPGGKLLLQAPYTFVINPDGKKINIYGLKLTDDSDFISFQKILLTLIDGLSLKPRVSKVPPPQEQQPPVQHQNFFQQNQQPQQQNENKSFMPNQPNEKDIIRDLLTEAIQKGDVAEAQKQVELLANMKAKLTIQFIESTESDDDDVDDERERQIELTVKVVDCESDMDAPLQIFVSSLKETLIRDLKHMFWEKYRIDVTLQRWIILKRMVEDKDSLQYCGVQDSDTILYLYVKARKEEPLYDKIPEPGSPPFVRQSNNQFQQQQQDNFQQQQQDNFQQQQQQNFQDQGKVFHQQQQDNFQQQQQNFQDQGKVFHQQQQDNFQQQQQQNFQDQGKVFHQGQQIFSPHPQTQLPRLSRRPQELRTYPGQQPFSPHTQQQPSRPHTQEQMFRSMAVGGSGPMNDPNKWNVATSGGPSNRPQVQQNQNSFKSRKQKVAKVGWECTSCTYKNLPTYPSCQICFELRPKDYTIPPGYTPTQEEQERLDRESLNEKLTLESEFKIKEEEQKKAQDNYLITLAYAQNRLLPNSEEFDCVICYTNIDKGEGVVLRECLHTFCKECLIQTINASEDPEVHCPENEAFPCPAVITDQEIRELLTDEEYGKHLERGLAQAEMAANNSFHCKSVNCKGWCIYEDDVNEFPCQLCNKTNCLTCKAIHEELTCKQYQEDLKIRAENDEAAKKTQEMLDELVRKGEAMNCPQCKVILQKKSGCDWMRCTMCKTEICWATKGPRWGPGGKGDTTAGCKCGLNGVRCTPTCGNCH